MSTVIRVFFRGALPDTAKLTRGLKGLGFTLSITPPAYSLEKHSGYMPMLFRRDETGVEFYIDDGRDVVEDALSSEQIDKIDPSFDRCASFRWSSAEDEMVCGLCCAAALAKLVNGIVYEETDGMLWSTTQAIEEAKKYFEEFANKTDPTRGTRTSDIKRYLKSLLKQRSDLVLVGRDLLIRPVRHLLRGALLDRTSDKYRFNVYRYIAPLYDAESLEYSTSLNGPDFYVWKPHFEPMLLDRLAKDVFGQAGRLTTVILQTQLRHDQSIHAIAFQPSLPVWFLLASGNVPPKSSSKSKITTTTTTMRKRDYRNNGTPSQEISKSSARSFMPGKPGMSRR